MEKGASPTKQRLDERRDVRAELTKLEQVIAELKQQYEQYFLGIVPLPPDALHREVRLAIRRIRQLPFKNSEMKFKMRAIEGRYNTFNTYWQRVLREKENGTYARDLFKAEVRAQATREEKRANTVQGAADRQLRALFESYKGAVEKQSGKDQHLSFDKFRQSVMQRSKDFKEKTGATKVSFKVAVKDGKVTLQVKPKG